jgi:hypothetical protein
MKLESKSATIFCVNCGTQMQAEDAFVFYELKTGSVTDVEDVESIKVLRRCAMDSLKGKKYELADSCFAKILKSMPDDYQIWRLRALAVESEVVNGMGKAFYEYNPKKSGLVENGGYLKKYKEYCANAVKHCPRDESEALAEEFNDHIREHFSIAHRIYKRERRRAILYKVFVGAALLILSALALHACR